LINLLYLLYARKKRNWTFDSLSYWVYSSTHHTSKWDLPFLLHYTTYNNKKAIIKANNPVGSEKANHNIAYVNNCPLKEVFLTMSNISAPNTTLIPIPTPIKPVIVSPVLIILAAYVIFFLFYFNYYHFRYK